MALQVRQEVLQAPQDQPGLLVGLREPQGLQAPMVALLDQLDPLAHPGLQEPPGRPDLQAP